MIVLRSSSRLLRLAAFLFFILQLQACNQDQSDSSGTKDNKTRQSSYADETVIHHAKGFSIAYRDHYKLVSIVSQLGQAADTARFILLDRGTQRPADFPDAQMIEIPIRSLVATSSTHIGFLAFLNAENTLSGLASLQYVFSPRVQQLIAAGKIVEVGKDQGLNQEKLVAMHPDLVMTTGGTGGMGQYQLIRQAGIPVLPNSEWVENTPLARAEWVKLFAALLNKEKLVNEKFAALEKEYQTLADLARQSQHKPSVLSGLNTKDAWFMPGGQSYMARFFADAGAAYPWSDTKNTGSLSLSFEAVYPAALQAEYWLNVGFDQHDSRRSVLAADARYADFQSFKSGKMYSYNNRVNASGSNDFFESGTVSPQLVLADLIHILHPELLPEHSLFFYKKLP